MSVDIQYDQDVAVVSMQGKLMGGPETRLCGQALQNLIKKGVRKITIDMSGVDWLNSGGMGMLMAAYNRLRKEGGTLCLSGTTPGTRRL
ncbi:MAG TPA: anti-sigma factor antagonist, partial [bacterium]|nr:anti-sigma factor antagonist [bacterium]